MQKVEFDFQVKEEQQRRLTEIADKLLQINRHSCVDAVQELRQGWQGECSIKFINKLQNFAERLQETERTLQAAVNALEAAGTRAALIEEKVKQIAENQE